MAGRRFSISAYTRFTHQPTIDNAVAIARPLLDAGANPNDFYMAGDAKLHGAGRRRRGRRTGFAAPAVRGRRFQLLLERGAEPFDIQVLYNTHFSGDMIWWLDLSTQHTIEDGPQGRLGRSRLVDARHGRLRARRLLHPECGDQQPRPDAGRVGPDPRGSPERTSSHHPKFKPLTNFVPKGGTRRALRDGESAAALRRIPSEPVLEGEDAFVAACLRMDRDGDHAHLAEHPGYLHSPKAIFAAARRDRVDVVEMLLDLGVPVEIENAQKQRALHMAAGGNALRVAAFLIERGAEIDPRELEWNGTPIGCAAYGDRWRWSTSSAVTRRNVWTLCFRGYVDRLREVLAEDPALARR